MKESGIKARRYSAIKNRVFFLELLIGAGLLVLVQLGGISNGLKSGIMRFTDNFFLINAAYATLLGIILYIGGLPLSFYKGYALEHSFGLSNQSPGGWLKDEFKKGLISYIIFLLFVEFLYLFMRYFSSTWWIWMAGAWMLFGVVFAKIVPVAVIPLFFRYSELKNNELKARLVRLAEACGIRILNVFRLDLSAKTKKANAALTGMGNTRRVLLADTLLEHYTSEEIEVVLAHELAHHKFRHIWRSLIFGGIYALTGFFLINASLMPAAKFLNLEAMHDIVGLPAIMFFLTVFSVFILPVQNWYSRGLEKRADLFAIKITGLGDAFISCMNKLADQNLANVSPSRFIEIMRYDHPPISKRIRMAEKVMKER